MGSHISMKKVKLCFLILLLLILLTTLIFILAIVIRTAVFKPPKSYGVGVSLPEIENLPSKGNISKFRTHLTEAIKLKTISYDDNNDKIDNNDRNINYNQFLKLHALIVKSFPSLHKSRYVIQSTINKYSLLYEVLGTNSSMQPALFVSHLDVVPTDGQKWDVEPFAAEFKNGFIYGRGAIDNKPVVFAILEALEFLISQKERPKRTILVCLGHDEEIGGFQGAQKVAQQVESKGYTKLMFVLDEGTPIVNGMMGVEQPVAMLSVAEKGYLTLELSVDYLGGHSSMPGKQGAISILAAALVRLNSNPHPACLANDDIFTIALQKLAPYMKWWNRMAIANIDLFRSVIIEYISKETSVDAIIRTTTALTQFHAGTKNNVLPQTARAIINHRVHPCGTLQEAVNYDKKVVTDDRVKVKTIQAVKPTKISPYLNEKAPIYSLLEETLQMMNPEIIVIPGLLVGNTDSRWFKNLTDKIYKISPIQMARDDISGFHGSNERIAMDSYLKIIDFYYRLMNYIDILPDIA